MRLVGLTGSIGSGKSSVSARLAEAGAVIVDADEIVRELQQPGQPVLQKMLDRWGSDIVDDAGHLDRAAVAEIVFRDTNQLAELEAIVHPALRVEILARIEAQSETKSSVVLDMALLVERGRQSYEMAGIIVVDCLPSIAVARLIQDRGFTNQDALARISRQASRDSRLAVANYVIDNSGSKAELDDAVRQCHLWVRSLPERSDNPAAKPAATIPR